MNIFEYIDINVVITIALVAGMYLFLRYGKGKFSNYEDVKLALMLAGTIMKPSNIKTAIDIAQTVVKDVETLDHDTPNELKKKSAMIEVAGQLREAGIVVDNKVVDILVETAVAKLPKTNKE